MDIPVENGHRQIMIERKLTSCDNGIMVEKGELGPQGTEGLEVRGMEALSG